MGKRKTDFYQLILYISFLPYIHRILYALYCSIYESPVSSTAAYAAFQVLLEFWRNEAMLFAAFFYSLIFPSSMDWRGWAEILDPLSLCVFFGLSYQMWYFIRYLRVRGKKKLMIFFLVLSLICWLLLLVFGVYSFYAGYNTAWFGTDMVYGWEAVKAAFVLILFLLSLIPVFPLSFLYILMFFAVQAAFMTGNRTKKRNHVEHDSAENL